MVCRRSVTLTLPFLSLLLNATFSFLSTLSSFYNPTTSAAGVPEALSSMAQSHLEQGVASPFLVGCFFSSVIRASSFLSNTQYTARPYIHRTVEDMRKNLQVVGSTILSQGLPAEFGPFVIGLTGYLQNSACWFIV